MDDASLSAGTARSELYRVMGEDTDFEVKAEQALELGKEYLGVENGHITRIEQESDYWKTLVSTDPPDGQFPPGLVLDLGSTYCRLVVDQTDSVAIHDATEQGFEDDPAYEEHEVQCYHGTNITLDEDSYGTVCFVSENSREQSFSDDETMFAELIGRLLERELERQRSQRKIDRLEEFASVVSHDVRNPLNVAQSSVAVARDTRDDDRLDTAVDALDRIETIIESMLTVARQGRTVTETETVTLWSVAEQCWQRVETGRETIDVDSSIQFRADRERVKHLFENLFRNAVEHGSTSPDSETHRDAVEHGSTSPDSQARRNAAEHAGPDVTVRVGTLTDREGFYVADDGPGIPEDERDTVFESGYTTGENGAGLGLAIVESVANAHDWTVSVTDSETGGARFEISDVVVQQ